MAAHAYSIARSILLHGSHEKGERADRSAVLKSAGGVAATTFRSAAEDIGSKKDAPGLAFFDSTKPGRISFGPGAGVVVGLSVGAQTVRAVLVDANGWEYYPTETGLLANQLAAHPNEVLERIKEAAASVLSEAFAAGELLVDGRLVLLGWGVAWPTPIDREYKAAGHSLAHPIWRSNQGLDQRVRNYLGVRNMTTYALNDAHAAALAVAHRETHQPEHRRWRHPRMTMVLRLAGNIGGASIILAEPEEDEQHGPTSGFKNSILLGGVDNHAGEIGHAPVSTALVEDLQPGPEDDFPALARQPCSCTPVDEEQPHHLEAYASALALTQRLDPRRPRRDVLNEVLRDPEHSDHERALTDIGALVGDSLLGPIAMLNPAMIALTGSLALPPVHAEIERRLTAAHRFGTQPSVTALTGQDNDFVRAKGAALALMRDTVHRRLDELLDHGKERMVENVTKLGKRFAKNPL